MKRIPLLRAVLIAIWVVLSFIPLGSLAEPRSPLPPWPESPLQRWNFDAAYWASPNDVSALAAYSGDLVESWSGYALQRDGVAASAIVMPGLDANGQTNLAAAEGSIRFWFSPAWGSANVDGQGPGDYARLLELVTANGSVAWSLYASPDGCTAFLSGQDAQGAGDFLKADIAFEAGGWYLLTLNYSPKGTALFVNTNLVAEGAGVAAVDPASAALALGSDGGGGH